MLKWSSKQKHTQHNHKCNMTIVNDPNRMTPLCCVFTLLSLPWPRLIYTVIAKGNNMLSGCWNFSLVYRIKSNSKASDSYSEGSNSESSQVDTLGNTWGAHTHSPPWRPLWLVSIWKDCTFLPGNDPFDSVCVRRNSAVKNKSAMSHISSKICDTEMKRSRSARVNS